MEIKRKIYGKFLTWKNEVQGKKALLIEGARRVGKTTWLDQGTAVENNSQNSRF